MDLQQYETLSKGVLNKILDSAGDLDASLRNNVLEIKTGTGVYIVNRQPFKRELWVSSPRSGPHHFRYVNGEWRDRNKEILNLLGKELSLTFS
jgi:iron donor protein CyaY